MNILDRLEEVARAASDEADGDWFCPDLLDSDEPIHSTRKARAHIAAFSPDAAIAVIAVCRAAKAYYMGYAQDEAEDGEYADAGKDGPNTGCSNQQARDALALREALAALDAVEGNHHG